MGIYLSTPCSDVEREEGEGNGVKYAVAEMQGWRKNMEDAHITIADLKSYINNESVPEAISVFGVFDGHGGKEVAKFARLKYAEVLVNLDSFKAGEVETALKESFHMIDELIEDGHYDTLLKELRALPNPSDTHKESVKASPDDAFLKAVRGDLDFDDEEDGEEGDEEDGKSNGSKKGGKGGLAGLSTTQAVDLIRSILNNAARAPQGGARAVLMDEEEEESSDEEDNRAQEKAESKFSHEGESVRLTGSKAEVEAADEKDAKGVRRDASKREFDELAKDSGDSDAKEASSAPRFVANEVSPKKRNPNLSLTIDDEAAPAPAPAEESAMDVVKDSEDSSPRSTGSGSGFLNRSRYNNPDAEYGPPAALSGNTMSCKLKDHRIPAGCTAIVAFKVGKMLYVANAGDSRGVLCRQGNVAFALSEDHKPQAKSESERITNAGGFVNVVGRINGNLNLSRSLGDMKYKQLYRLSRAEQIITAEPDISVTPLEDTDRFFILACDGIWDCLTNQQAVDFVSERLDRGMGVSDIVNDMCKHCLADDPRAATGIGSDNMTCMVVLLNQ